MVTRYYCGLDRNDINDVIFKIGLYFAWLGFYNQMLIFPALFGLFVFLYGIVTMNMKTVNYPGSEVCHNETMKSTVLCPECPENCDFRSELEITLNSVTQCFHSTHFRRLGTACKLYLVSYLFDNDMTVVFAFVISVWGEPI